MITQNMKLLLLALICAMFVGFFSVSQIIEGDQLPPCGTPCQSLSETSAGFDVSAFEKAAAGIVLEAKGSAELKMEDEQ